MMEPRMLACVIACILMLFSLPARAGAQLIDCLSRVLVDEVNARAMRQPVDDRTRG